MEKVIPTFYAEYGRYISRFRMIPSSIDCLIPVERRVLVIMNRFGPTHPVKSFKIDGCVTGELHPHGSAYGTITQLVRNGFASSDEGSWGGIGWIDAPAAASRYTETRILPWVSKFAFEFIKYVPWEMLELDSEPLYLPSILPLGLIGNGVFTSISFYRTMIPKYSKEDLAKRLEWLIVNGKPQPPKNWNGRMTEDKYGPCIKPNKTDCELVENEKNAYYKLLMKGEGEIEYLPHVYVKTIEVDGDKKKQKVQVVSVEGRAPNTNFDAIRRAEEKNLLPLACSPIDQSKKMDVKVYFELKRGTNAEEFAEKLSEKYLNKVTHFKCYMCDLNGVVSLTPIDDLLLNCYSKWKMAYVAKLKADVLKVNEKILEYHICSFIRDRIKENTNNLEEILKKWKKKTTIDLYNVDDNNKIFTEKYEVTVEDISNIYNGTSVKRLVEYRATLEESESRIKSLQNELDNLDEICLGRVKEIHA